MFVRLSSHEYLLPAQIKVVSVLTLKFYAPCSLLIIIVCSNIYKFNCIYNKEDRVNG